MQILHIFQFGPASQLAEQNSKMWHKSNMTPWKKIPFIVTGRGRFWNVGKSQIANEGTISKVKIVQESNFNTFAFCNCDSKVAIKVRLVVSRAGIFYGSSF